LKGEVSPKEIPIIALLIKPQIMVEILLKLLNNLYEIIVLKIKVLIVLNLFHFPFDNKNDYVFERHIKLLSSDYPLFYVIDFDLSLSREKLISFL
jgi:hypothetical protein